MNVECFSCQKVPLRFDNNLIVWSETEATSPFVSLRKCGGQVTQDTLILCPECYSQLQNKILPKITND
jgi:hypothetical protein